MTGGSGRLGRLLRAAWDDRPNPQLRATWTARKEGAGFQWDMQDEPPSGLPRKAVLLHLAGVVRGSGTDLARNSALALSLIEAARRLDAESILFASTVAVYAPRVDPSDEADPPDPQGDYGKSKLAAELLLAAAPCPVTRLRIGNVAGADALLGPRTSSEPILLDPVPGRDGGPVRSWIGPRDLARIIASLCTMTGLPPVLNLALDPPLPMARLLDASGRPWRYGAANARVVPDATVSTSLLASLMPLSVADAADLASQADWARQVLG